MRPEPRLAIGVPVFNGERFLPRLIEALSAQTFRDFEVVVSDNASTDRTEEICREWAKQDERVRYHRNLRNVGARSNFNLVFQLCQAPLFKWAACDDTIAPDYLEACVAILDADPSVVLAQSDVALVDEHHNAFQRDAADDTFIIPGTDIKYKADAINIGKSQSRLRRVYDMLFRCRYNAQVFGVVRRDAMERTLLLQNFVGSEKATVLELALLGRFRQDRRQLFNRCYYPGVAGAMPIKKANRYFGSNGSSIPRPFRMLSAYARAVWSSPAGVISKFGCSLLVLACGAHYFGRLLVPNDARDWPFRAAWGSNSNRPKAT